MRVFTRALPLVAPNLTQRLQRHLYTSKHPFLEIKDYLPQPQPPLPHESFLLVSILKGI
jgi:hypothetical protein